MELAGAPQEHNHVYDCVFCTFSACYRGVLGGQNRAGTFEVLSEHALVEDEASWKGVGGGKPEMPIAKFIK